MRRSHGRVLWPVQQQELYDKIQVTATGCVGPCSEGPTVLVYPEGVMYGGVSKGMVNTIIEEHLLGDKPVQSLLMPAELWSGDGADCGAGYTCTARF